MLADPERARRAAAGFAPSDAELSLEALGAGHIHDTWAVRWIEGDAPRGIVLQRINTRVFSDPTALAANVSAVTRHLRAKLVAEGVPDPERRSLEVVPARSGGPLHRASADATWRAFRLIEATRTRLDTPSPDEAEAAARAFGAFARRLADLREPLAETIPRFHDFAARVDALDASVARTRAELASDAAEELAELRAQLARVAAAAAALPALPRRIAHHDTKLSNVLFDAEGDEALCVVDLDTVMPGHLASDFGEMVRSAACTGPEDDPASCRVDLEVFEALALGYAAETRELLTPAERAALPLAGALMALMNATRFLTDHVDGDAYFRVERPGQNLDRAATQRLRAERLLEREDELHARIDAAYRSS